MTQARFTNRQTVWRGNFAGIERGLYDNLLLQNIAKNLVYAGSKQNVKMTVVDGKILYENGLFTTVDAGEIYEQANRLARELCGD